MINFKSESSNKTQQNNAKILFGKTGLTVIKKLEEYSKEKALDTAGINALLEVLKTKDTELLEKFASSKTGKTLVTNCKQLSSAKTFSAIIKNIKAIKPLKSFDKFTVVDSKTNSRGARKNPIKSSNMYTKKIFSVRGPYYLEHGLGIDVKGNSINLSDQYTIDMFRFMRDHGIGLKVASNSKIISPIPVYRIYGTKKNLEKFALQLLDYTRPDLLDLNITKTDSALITRPIDAYDVMGTVGKNLAAYFAKREEDIDYTGRPIGPNTIELGITTPNTKTRNRRLHNFKLVFTKQEYGVYIAKYQTRSKTFPSVLIKAKSTKELERKAKNHIQTELDKDGRP